MKDFTTEEQGIISQAIAILNGKLKNEKINCNNSVLVKTFLRLQLEKCEREHLGALYLDNQLRLIEYRIVFSGAVNYCTMSPREFAKDALTLNATNIILAHNHPSGDDTPSHEDIKATLKARDALNLLEINVLDHFVVGHNQISSLSEMGLI